MINRWQRKDDTLMKTIEAAFIMPIICILIALTITASLEKHDEVVCTALQNALLIEQAESLENPLYSPPSSKSKRNFENVIYDFFIIKDKPSFNVKLSGSELIIHEVANSSNISTLVSNYDKCDKLRKEYALKNALE